MGHKCLHNLCQFKEILTNVLVSTQNVLNPSLHLSQFLPTLVNFYLSSTLFHLDLLSPTLPFKVILKQIPDIMSLYLVYFSISKWQALFLNNHNTILHHKIIIPSSQIKSKHWKELVSLKSLSIHVFLFLLLQYICWRNPVVFQVFHRPDWLTCRLTYSFIPCIS